MIKKYQGPGPYYDCAASGNVLTIAGEDCNLDDLQRDSQQIIDIIVGGMFAANIIIPPATYKTVNIDDKESRELQPVDLDRVELILWTRETKANDNDIL